MNEKIIPQHVGIILDGNRRWARRRGLPTFFGHKRGLANIKKIIRHARLRGIKILTVYAFSTENWNRSAQEVEYLMRLFEKMIDNNLKAFVRDGIRFGHLGRLDKFPPRLKNKLKQAILSTKKNQEFVFNVALNYGGRDEIVRAVKKIIRQKIPMTQVTLDTFSSYLDTAGQPDPDLIIRTSGEQRLSGFLLWQASYSELYFPKVYWPDFDEAWLDKALKEYALRHRRYGK